MFRQIHLFIFVGKLIIAYGFQFNILSTEFQLLIQLTEIVL